MTGTLQSLTRETHRRAPALLFAWFSFVLGLAAQPANISIAPAPAWVLSAEWTPATARRTNETSEGTHYLLYERQQNPALQENFDRNVVLMQNETGVQDSGNLSFGFDPSYQKLIIHRVQIHRNGQVLDRLDKAKIRLIQPESRLGGHLFTGEQTAVVFVEDLRVGDVLEYAYTTRGANPILGEHFSARFLAQSGIPVDRQRMRVVWSSAKPLHIRQHLTDATPTKTFANGATDYVWDFTNLTAVAREDFTPPGSEPYPYVELSNFDNWSRVVEWALPLYAVPETNLPPELQKLIDHWQRTAVSNDEKARLALQFVQDDLRYTGLELGPDSYRPTHPFETFEKRFGDCKGKVALLCTMFRAMNIEAYPALVNTYMREGIMRRLPSPFAFNHVIVKLNLGGRTIWLDPTISHQGGQLSNRSVPPLGKALVIQPGVAGLEDIPPMLKDGPLHHVLSTFRITDYTSSVPLTVRSTYRGSAADSMREALARSDAKQLQKSFLNFYARYYSGIQDERPLDISDDRDRNILTVTEHYVVTNLWKLEEARNKWVAAFYGEALMDMLTDPATRLRKRPLWISFPLHREQEVVVHLPEKGWDIPPKTDEVTHEAFAFRYRRDYSGSTVRFRYECETKASEIPAEQVASYLTKRVEMENLLGDTLERSDDSRPILARINWLMVVVAGFGLCAALIGSVLVWRSTNIPVELPPLLPEERRYSGLGGWLFLIGFGLCIGPFTRLVVMAKHWEGFFSLDVWQTVAMPNGEQYHPLYAPLLIFEVLGNSLLLGLNVLALCLYFGKRRIFPKIFIALMIANAVVLGIDAIFGGMIPFVAGTDTSSRREFFRASLAAMIWTAYMVKSRRVRATFREKQPDVNPPPIPTVFP